MTLQQALKKIPKTYMGLRQEKSDSGDFNHYFANRWGFGVKGKLITGNWRLGIYTVHNINYRPIKEHERLTDESIKKSKNLGGYSKELNPHL